MSLMQLLTVGQSLRSVRDQPCRYRMTQQNLLPKFGLPASEESDFPVAAAPRALVERTPVKLAPNAATLGKETTSMTVVEVPSPAAPATAVAHPVQAYPAGRWTMKNPFHRKAASDAARAPVQGELSLDMIRPVRNDLSDSDLEVVPAKRAAATPVASPESVTKDRNPVRAEAKPLWTRLQARLLRRV